MSFTIIGRNQRSVREGRITAWSSSSGQIVFVVSVDIAEKVGLLFGSRFNAFVGDGPDTGLLKISKTEAISGRKVRVVGGKNPSRHPVLGIARRQINVPQPAKAIDLPFKVNGTDLIIDIRPLQAPVDELKAA